MDIFDSFSPGALQCILIAQEEMRRLGHNHLGSDAVLLGLLGEKNGIAASVLQTMGIQLGAVRAEIARIEGQGTGSDESIPFTPTAKKLFELAQSESVSMGNTLIDTEHLLLAMESENLARRVLENLGVDVSNIRRSVVNLLDERPQQNY